MQQRGRHAARCYDRLAGGASGMFRKLASFYANQSPKIEFIELQFADKTLI